VSEPVRILIGDVLDGLRTLDAGSVQCCVTSPPYWGLRDYGVDGQIGLEPTPEAFVAKMVEVFREVRRVLREDGVCFLNIGDSYAANRGGSAMPAETLAGGVSGRGDKVAKRGRESDYVPHRDPASHGLKHKDLCMIPWRVALALQADGWYLRSVIVWAKKSPMPESVTDRPTSSWEPIFLLAKGERYFMDMEAVKEPNVRVPHAGQHLNGEARASGPNDRNGHSQWEQPDRVWADNGGRNQRNVWHLGPEPYSEAHFATFPTEIPRRAIKAGTSEKGACPECGAPWKRVATGGAFAQLDRRNPPSDWQPTCKCGNPNTRPCVVLDPFLGSGTTIAVARTLGRHGVGCELNPAYAELARERIGKAEKPSTFVSAKAEESPLFSGATK
jgi:DNA modification methylase